MNNSKSLNDIRDEIEGNLETMREVVASLLKSLRALNAKGMRNTEYFEDYVVAHLAILTDHEHGYISRDATLSDLLEAVETFIEKKKED